jgi:uncharacterized heparinase superfamily protein
MTSDGPPPDPPPGGTFRTSRLSGDRGPSLGDRLGERLADLRFKSPIHRMALKGRYPLKLLGVPEDPVPGDTNRAERLRAGRVWHGGHGIALADGPLDDPECPAGWKAWLHGWTWLRDLATAPPQGQTEAVRVERLARRWIERWPDYDATAWAPDLTGRRVLMAIAHVPLLIPRHDQVHHSAVLNAIARWCRHLERAALLAPEGFPRIEALAGLLGGSLLLTGHDDRAARAEALLARSLDLVLEPDGAISSRSPLDLASLGDHLLTLSAFHAARGQRPSATLLRGLAAVRAGLGGLLMGDGLPAAWHGGQPSPAQVARLGVAAGPAPQGFLRLAAGRTILVADTSPPPPQRQLHGPHASTLAFVLSDGAQPLVISCGGAAGPGPAGAEPIALPAELAEGLRATAAHTTLVIADTNSTRLKSGGARRPGGVEEVTASCRADAEGSWIEARHDGYRKRFGIDHLRRLWLGPDGADLRGEDFLLPSPTSLRRIGRGSPERAAIRFHIAPGASIAPAADGRGLFIRLGPAKAPVAWSFRANLPPAARLAVEPSLSVGWDGTIRPAEQIVIHADTAILKDGIGWAFRRQTRS